ncbi:hypothetical protein DICPUDRAFT_156168 [Dictyostelium purpureum]|uniref:Uncharacterized protein n=1 Tax=Dictyostelium purpureum TaxID=5786 RepID=F0ZVW4_DICPU|nr:uncharacterized protein DICPUDRAFT_156168 [Dictyostelium purpureum]EGC31924.1 hypothetical protein DICPUDRAFT_156168 [Dictyostelium purpureum]|eukprot:XP_003291561.1 hypothetical protein DICPUDRAFT_156168 [Dictyostelium purpureum]
MQCFSSKVNIDKSTSIIIGDCGTHSSPIPIANTPQRYLGHYFDSQGIVRKLPKILKSIRASLVLWKSTGATIKTKINILKSFALSKLIY